MNGSSGSKASTSSVSLVADSNRGRNYVPATQSATCDNLDSQRHAFWIVTSLLVMISALSIFNLYLLVGMR